MIGSLQLLAACEKAESVRTIVVRGSAAIYGAEPNAPQFFTEDMARRFPLRTRFQRDVGELENYFETFARRYPRGDGDDAALPADARHGDRLAADALPARSPSCPTQLGFDPLLQFVHDEDAVSGARGRRAAARARAR